MLVTVVINEQQRKDAFAVRTKVFVEEQKVPPEIELDQFDEAATHFVVYNEENLPIGAARLRNLDGYGKIERVCVDAKYRNCGIGAKLMSEIEEVGTKLGFTSFKLNSQMQAVPFYLRLGYEVCSEQFYDAGIPHVTMIKRDRGTGSLSRF